MGVKGLWTLLEPCGRRIDVHALRGKRLAVDASVWIFRFLKAMRDDRGDPLPNAHLIGFLRRICKLLYLNIWPVFVFDGSTPALKRKTVHERRKRREQQQARVKRTAEKLLLNRLKQYAVSQVREKGLSLDGGSAGKNGGTCATGGQNGATETPGAEVTRATEMSGHVTSPSAEVLEEINGTLLAQGDGSLSSDDEQLLGFEVDVDNGVDPEVLSTLPPSMQLEIMLQVREKKMNAARGGFESLNGKPEEFSQYQMQQYLDSTGLRRQLDTIRGVSRQDTDVARRVAGEEGTHYVLYREDQHSTGPSSTGGGVGGGHVSRGAPFSSAAASVPPLSNMPVVPVGKRPLKITFDIDAGDLGGNDDEIDWEDVEEAEDGDTAPDEGQHRHRRSKYWTLSHGFQKGRSLGNWGFRDEEGRVDVHEDEKIESYTQEAVTAATALATKQEDARLVGEAIGRSLDELRDDEEGMINEAIRRSLCDAPVEHRLMGDLTTAAASSLGTVRSVTERPEKVSGRKLEEFQVVDRDIVAEPKLETPMERVPEPRPEEGALGLPSRQLDAPSAREDPPKLIWEGISDVEPNDAKNAKGAKSVPVVEGDLVVLDPVDRVENQIARPALASEIIEVNQQVALSGLEQNIRHSKTISTPGAEPKPLLSPPTGPVQSPPRRAALPAPLPDMDELLKEEALLRADRRKASGQGDSPTDQMFTECQELLQLFGIPYIIAPTEAEAQCAWLDANGLVDGVVTDDNDAFLFGGRRVYRHIFEESKYVEEYRTDDVERELGLSREGLISLALLLGSDYTPGIAGVGIVNAVEIMSTFPGYEGLVEFEQWVNGIDEDIVALMNVGRASRVTKGTSEFKIKHKAARKSWVLPEDFPSKEVMDAYHAPVLDKSKDKFTFVSPDFRQLADFAMRKFGWEETRIKELLDPVEKSLKERDTQQTLDGFLTFRQKFARVKSKRLAKAVETVKRNKKRRDSGETVPGGELVPVPSPEAAADAVIEGAPSLRKDAEQAKPRKPPPKKRAKKDPNAPKKALSAFILFSNDKRAEVTAELKAANPEIKGVAEVGKRLGEMWKALSDAEKEPFYAQAAADKVRYGSELLEYRRKLDESLLPGADIQYS